MTAAPVCTVWWAPVGDTNQGVWSILSEQERERAASFRHLKDQQRSAVGAAVLRLAVHHLTGEKSSRVVVNRRCRRCGGPHGRPELPGRGLFASISHAGDWVTVGLTGAGPVGVDIEPRGGGPYRWLVDQMAGAEEASAIRGDDDALVVWTRKEAVLKATGEGLTTPLREVVVAPPSAGAALVRHGSRPDLSCQLTDMTLGDGYAGAVAILTATEVTVREVRMDPAPRTV